MMTSIVLDCLVFGNIFLFFGSLMQKLGEILKKYCFNVFFIKKYFKKQTTMIWKATPVNERICS